MDDHQIIASVIITVRSDERAIRTLKTLENQTFGRDQYELILIENGSEYLRESIASGVMYRHLPEANMPAARNLGLQIARGKYVLFTDADCVPRRDWIASMVDALETTECAGVGGRIERFQPRTVTQRFGSNIVNGQNSLSYLPALHLPYVAGANSGFRRSLLISLGGFDEQLLSGNDVDICYKIGLAGFDIGLESRSEVLHDNRSTIISHFRRFSNYAKFQVYLFKKYKHISRRAFVLDTYAWRLIFTSLLLMPIGLVRLVIGKPSLFWRSFLSLVEAVGVIYGNIRGSVAFMELYI